MQTWIRRGLVWLPLLFPAYVLRVRVGAVSTTLLEIATLAFIGLATWQSPKLWKKGFAATQPFHIPAAMWLGATIMAIGVAPHHLAAFGLWRAFVLEPMAYALLLAGILSDHAPNERDMPFRALAWSVIGVTIIAVVQYLTGKFIPHPWDTTFLTRRATGPFPFPNALALYVVPIAALALSRIHKQAVSRMLAIATVCAGGVSVLLAKSVGGAIGLLAAILAFLLWHKQTRRMTLVLAGVVFVAIVNSPFADKIQAVLSFSEWSGKVRTVIWNETIQMLSMRPFLGAGFGAYPDVIKPFHHATWMEIFQYPHNILLNIWSETGILGLAAFTGICLAWVRSSLKQRTAVLILPLIAIIVHGIVDVPYFKNDLAMVFWCMIALISINANQSEVLTRSINTDTLHST